MQQNKLTFAVGKLERSVIIEGLMNYREQKRKFDSLHEMFGIALLCSDFVLAENDLAAAKIANGTGYYDPLKSAIFTYNDEVIGTGRTISTTDIVTKRRLYIVVIKPGVNFILHDRYPQDAERVCLVSTSPVPLARILVGMSSNVWCDGILVDMVAAGDFFGFEIDRMDSRVFIPHEPMINKLRTAIDMFAQVEAKLNGALGQL